MGGIMASGSALMISVLNFFQSITGSYGIAIILLTVSVRLLMYPLSHKQAVSMSEMQKIQPRLKMLQEKYAHDKERLNKEMMLLYKEHNVNPAAGCLPLLIQLPILIMLFRALNEYDVANSVFMTLPLEKTTAASLAEAAGMTVADGKGGIGLLFSALIELLKNPAGFARVDIYLTSVLFVIFNSLTMLFQQKLSGSANNPQMATMNMIMPIMMGVICVSLPGGVLLYWATSSLIGIAQQWMVMRRTKLESATKPTLYRNKPIPGKAESAVPFEEDDYDDEYDDDEYYDDDDDYDDEYDDDEYVNGDGERETRK